MRRWTAWIGALQTQFNRDLTGALKGLHDGGAFWWLGSVSFLYGIAHAAGPGHGKVVISSYLVANEARIRRGVLIAFIAAFVQAVVAVGIIGLMAVVLNMTSMAINSTAQVFEAGSFALVIALGLFLLARKGRAAWAVIRGGDPHAGHIITIMRHTPTITPTTRPPPPCGEGLGEGQRRHRGSSRCSVNIHTLMVPLINAAATWSLFISLGGTPPPTPPRKGEGAARSGLSQAQPPPSSPSASAPAPAR